MAIARRRVGRSLAHLVHENMGNGREVRIFLEHPKQHACRAKQQARLGALPRLTAHCVSNSAVAGTLAALGRDAIRHSNGRDATRLRDDDIHGCRPLASFLQQKLRHLRRLPGASLTLDDASWLRQCREQLVARLRHRKPLTNRSTRATASHNPW